MCYALPLDVKQEKTAIDAVRQYHSRTIQEIKIALARARQERHNFDLVDDANKEDVIAVTLECGTLAKELKRRQKIETLEYDRTLTMRTYVVPDGVPTQLEGLPGAPRFSLYAGNGIVKQAYVDQTTVVQMEIPATVDIASLVGMERLKAEYEVYLRHITHLSLALV